MPPRHSVLLVAMPFAGVSIPSIQLSVLEGYAKNHEVDIRTRNLYLLAADTYGLAKYQALIYPPGDSYIAQMAFARYLFPDHWQRTQHKIQEYYEAHIHAPTLSFQEYLNRTDELYQNVTEHLDWHTADLIGFTLNYGQLLPSLAIAKYIKEQQPEKKIVLGGSRVVGDMGCGILNAFEYIDYIVSGDGEDALVRLATEPDRLTEVPGLIYRNAGEITRNPAGPPVNTSTTPLPSYDQFFTELHGCSEELQQFFHYSGRLPVEISRGCWWNRCTFCNLNIQHTGYREKPISRIVNEIQYLSERYHILDFQLIGNTLPRTHYQDLFESLHQLGKDFSFFVEARAGQLLSDDYRRMKDAGFTTIQTGIESFSHHYLTTINKGVRVIDNIAALKFCKQYGITNAYNLVVRYPNEEPIDFEETQTLAHALQGYLDPPQLCPLKIMHGSPIQKHPEKYNIATLQPAVLDTLMYPPEILEKHFTFIYTFTTTTPVNDNDWETLVQTWKKTRDTAETEATTTHTPGDHLVFYSVDGGSFLKIYDKRDPAYIRILELNTLERQILLACTDITSYHDLQDKFAFFQETADNEKEHAQVFFKHLQGGNVEITATYPAGIIGTTEENLKHAAEGEHMEWGTLYPNAADTADKEGFPDVARSFRFIAKVEAEHEKRYLKLLENVTCKTVFKKTKPVKWRCRNCGYVHEGPEAPQKCPACQHPQSYYEIFSEPY